MSSVRAKLTYRPRTKLEVFYTGGAARLSPDGLHVACACGDETKVVDVATSAVMHTLPGDSEPITALAYSPDGSRIYTASRSLQQRCWDVAAERTLRTWKGHRAPVADMAVDASGGLLASGGADRAVRVWDTDGGYCTHVFSGHTGVVFSVLFHPKQLTVVSGGDDAEVRVWDLVDKSCIAVLKGHFSAVTSLALAPDNWTLLSGSRDKTVHMWDLRSHAKTATIPIHEAVEGVVALPATSAFPGVKAASKASSKAGKRPVYFVTAGERGTLRIWRSDTQRCVYEQPATVGGTSAAGSEITWMAPVPHARGLIAATGDCRLLVFEPQGDALAVAHQLVGNNDEVTDLCFVGPAAAPTHVAVATNSPAIRLFDTEHLGCSLSLEGHTDIVLALDTLQVAAESSGGDGGIRSLLLSGSKDNSMRLWEVPSGRCLGVGEGHIAAVSAVAFSQRGPKFVVSGGADKLLKVWNLPAALEAADGEGASLPAQMLVTAAVAAHDKDINAVAVSPNDALVVTASQDRTAKVWKLPSLVAVLTLRGHKRGVWHAAFSPVDQAVATASGDKTVRLWSLADGACLRTFEGHTASALRCCFLSAGTQLLSSGADGLVKLWSVRNGECLSTFDEHEGKVWAMAVGGAGESMLATGAADATVAVWEDCTAADEEAEAAEDAAVVLKQQDLSNALQRKDYAAAAALAFEMRQPRRLLSVVDAVQSSGGPGAGGSARSTAILESLAAGWDKEQLKAALEYIREWNTNSRLCHAAQALLAAILRRHPPQALLAVPGIAELLDGLTAYTQNHFARLGRLQRSAYLLDYTLASMNVLLPPAADDAAANGQPAANSVPGFGFGDAGGFAISEVIGEDSGAAGGGAAAAIDASPSPATPPQQEAAVAEGVAGSGTAADVAAADEHAGPAGVDVEDGRVAAASSRPEAAEADEDAATEPEAAQMAEPSPSTAKRRKSSEKKQKKRKAGDLRASTPVTVMPSGAGGGKTPRARKSKRTKLPAS